MSRRVETIPPAYFDDLYRDKGDPWGFRSSPYELAKYRDTLALLGKPRYAAALEVGCSIGVFTTMLADRCDRLVAVDASEVAVEAARDALAATLHVDLRVAMVPDGFPAGLYDAIVLSEVLYYLTEADLVRTAALARDALKPDGEIVICHWLGETDYPLTGEAAADRFAQVLSGGGHRHVTVRRDAYRLDRFEAVA